MSEIVKLPKLNCILLVDDDASTNFLHRLIIERAHVTSAVESVLNGREAMDLLTCQNAYANRPLGHCSSPELIFLDLHMPEMNGWEFLDSYEAHFKNNGPSKVLVVLTSSLTDSVKQGLYKARPMNVELLEKPLKKDSLLKIVNSYFSD